MVDDLKGSKKIVGIRQSTRFVKKGLAKKAFVAENAGRHVIEPFIECCRENGVSIEFVKDMDMLGRACGIDVGAAAAVIIE